MLKRYMHAKERYFAMRDDNRIVQPFAWGVEFVDPDAVGRDPREFFEEFSDTAIRESYEFFCSPEIADFHLNDRDLTWTSGIATPTEENNLVRATYFPKAGAKAAVLVLPHWNAKAGTYFDLCKVFNDRGFSALRLTLPYHEERMPPELERADYLRSEE